MQVVAEAEAGAADAADYLALADVLADTHEDRRLVAVAGRQRCTVLDAGVVAVAPRPAGNDDAAGVGGANRGAGRHADVDPGVTGLPRPALAERGGDRPVHRPDHRAGAAAKGPGRGARLRRAQLGRHLRLHLRQVALEPVPRRANAREDHLTPVARALQVG